MYSDRLRAMHGRWNDAALHAAPGDRDRLREPGQRLVSGELRAESSDGGPGGGSEALPQGGPGHQGREGPGRRDQKLSFPVILKRIASPSHEHSEPGGKARMKGRLPAASSNRVIQHRIDWGSSAN